MKLKLADGRVKFRINEIKMMAHFNRNKKEIMENKLVGRVIDE
jgi:hypothetical protein